MNSNGDKILFTKLFDCKNPGPSRGAIINIIQIQENVSQLTVSLNDDIFAQILDTKYIEYTIKNNAVVIVRTN